MQNEQIADALPIAVPEFVAKDDAGQGTLQEEIDREGRFDRIVCQPPADNPHATLKSSEPILP